jgi:hypothetical protein
MLHSHQASQFNSQFNLSHYPSQRTNGTANFHRTMFDTSKFRTITEKPQSTLLSNKRPANTQDQSRHLKS